MQKEKVSSSLGSWGVIMFDYTRIQDSCIGIPQHLQDRVSFRFRPAMHTERSAQVVRRDSGKSATSSKSPTLEKPEHWTNHCVIVLCSSRKKKTVRTREATDCFVFSEEAHAKVESILLALEPHHL